MEEKKLYGYTGKILRVNLTTGKISTFSSKPYQEKYLGGKGMLARLYWEEIGPAQRNRRHAGQQGVRGW